MSHDTNKKMLDREAVRSVIQQWNANRLDLFALSEPDEVCTHHSTDLSTDTQSNPRSGAPKLNCKCIFYWKFIRFNTCPFLFIVRFVHPFYFFVCLFFFHLLSSCLPQNLLFHGVMRFYFQDAGQKVATKCIRVASDATVIDVIGKCCTNEEQKPI